MSTTRQALSGWRSTTPATTTGRTRRLTPVVSGRITRVKTRASRDDTDVEIRTRTGAEAEARTAAPGSLSVNGLGDRCDSGDPDFELCAVSFDDGAITDSEAVASAASASSVSASGTKAAVKPGDAEPGAAAAAATDSADVSVTKSAVGEAYERGKWLVGLLILQSSSSFVLDKYQDLIREHLVVTLFLTMLVGAGGNAGNQSAIKVIRGMATGSISPTLDSLRAVMKQQITVAFILGTSLSAAGWVRVYVTNGSTLNSSAIAFSLFLIVCTSVIVGTLLPFGLAKAGQDPANAGTSIQVLMDVLGVLITCVSCHFILDLLVL